MDKIIVKTDSDDIKNIKTNKNNLEDIKKNKKIENIEVENDKNIQYILELDDIGNLNDLQEDEILTLPVHTLLRIRIKNTIKVNKPILFSNTNDESLTLEELKKEILKYDLSSNTDLPNTCYLPKTHNEYLYFDLIFENPGSIFFFIRYLNEENYDKVKNLYNTDDNEVFNFNYSKEIYIMIEPIIKIGKNDIVTSINNIQIQTILSKSIGKLKYWDHYFKEASILSKYINKIN
jgi:hypothetical protein